MTARARKALRVCALHTHLHFLVRLGSVTLGTLLFLGAAPHLQSALMFLWCVIFRAFPNLSKFHVHEMRTTSFGFYIHVLII